MRHRIYIPLADQPESLRPSDAKPLGYGKFTVVGPVARGERWQYMPGEVVECESQTLPDGSKGLVAVTSATVDPEYRSRRAVYGWCGAVVGAILGLWFAVWFALFNLPLLIAVAFGAVVFGFCSRRWGDEAWDILSRLLR
jgi:hypothetical protein